MNIGTSTPQILALKELSGNVPMRLDSMQQFFWPHSDTLIHFWVAVWFATALYLLLHVASKYSEYRKGAKK